MPAFLAHQTQVNEEENNEESISFNKKSCVYKKETITTNQKNSVIIEIRKN